MTSGSATLRVAVGSRTATLTQPRWPVVLPLVVPCGLLIVGACVGYFGTLDEAVARERLLGLVVTSGLAVGATFGLRRVGNPRPLLIGVSVLALLGGVWVIAASGADVFRGSVGSALQAVFDPIFGLAQVTDSVGVSNTRFIVGYNGLADLCLVAIFCCGALLLERPGRLSAIGLVAIVAVSVVLLVGTGARGGLTGLAAGVCALGLFAWPRRYAVLALLAAPALLGLAVLGIFDKGLEFSSTAGRLTYWGDLLRLLVEYPLSGVGLGVDTANRIAVQYEINPDPERVFYAHNTFVQSYLEQGPLGALGMLGLPIVAVAAALVARRYGVVPGRRALMMAGLGVVGGLEAHGLTDQVVTTNVGTGLVVLGVAAALAALTPPSSVRLAGLVRGASLVLLALAALLAVGLLVMPAGRAQVLLDLGGLKLNQALDPRLAGRSATLADAEGTLSLALMQDSRHPAVLRELARVRAARFDDAGALEALTQASQSSRLDAFDMLQIAHVYRDLGQAEDAYAWAARAYAAWDRPPEDAVMQVYAQSTLADSRAQTLANQAEAAMRARTFGEAHALFQQALTFEASSAYLQDRLGAAQRAVDKYGG